jgi:hypothetical protein
MFVRTSKKYTQEFLNLKDARSIEIKEDIQFERGEKFINSPEDYDKEPPNGWQIDDDGVLYRVAPSLWIVKAHFINHDGTGYGCLINTYSSKADAEYAALIILKSLGFIELP